MREDEEELIEQAAAESAADDAPQTDVLDGREVPMKPRVAAAVQSLRDRRPPLRAKGIFRHPSDWEQEEIDFIVDALKQHVPIYTIAGMLHCERHTLSKLIERMPELKQLHEDRYDDILEETEYQLDRLIKTGNVPLIIHVLNTLGRRRGGVWSQTDVGGGENGSEGRIVLGVIPQEDVEQAETEVKAVKAAEAAAPATGADPMAMAVLEDAVKEAVKEQTETMQPQTIEAEAVSVGPSPYENEPADFGYIGADMAADPWMAGADSPFAQ